MGFGLPDFSRRIHAEEIMDSPEADLVLLERTIHQFGTINFFLSSLVRLVVSRLFPLMERGREYRMVDVGAGGGDLARRISRAARRRGLSLRITALDHDERILPWARRAVADDPAIEVIHGAAADLPSMGRQDFVVSNHLLHHLRDEEIAALLEDADRAAGMGFVLDDLLRSAWSWLGYGIYASLFARGSLASWDGRLSIQRGFRPEELEALLARSAAISSVQVFRTWPGRVGFIRVGPRR